MASAKVMLIVSVRLHVCGLDDTNRRHVSLLEKASDIVVGCVPFARHPREMHGGCGNREMNYGDALLVVVIAHGENLWVSGHVHLVRCVQTWTSRQDSLYFYLPSDVVGTQPCKLLRHSHENMERRRG